MDSKLKTCSGKNVLPQPCNANTNANADRFTSLPDEILGRILSMLPTKDAVATLILSKRMRQALSWISSFDLDDSPISHCIEYPHQVERFPLFESFVDNLLMKFSPPNAPHLTRFRLHVCSNDNWLGHDDCESCDKDCFPDVLPVRLSEWISYPKALAQGGGLRELELSFFVRKPCQCELPPSLFSCQSLNMLKLESNLEIDNARIPMINLPNLKLLHLNHFVFNDDDFVSRLISSCSVLEDLSLDQCLWKIWNCLSISSPCLRRLSLYVHEADNNRWKSVDLLLIDTPNLQCLHYGDSNVATSYSIAPMNALVKASIYLHGVHVSFETELKLVTALSHVRELSLRFFDQISYFSGDLWDRLPVFRNLRTLKLGGYYNNKWDTLLPLILHRTPSLETLVFLEGAFWATDKIAYIDGGLRSVRVAALEAESWRTADAIPSCCFTHLKRIVFKLCFSNERELNAIKFLLAKSSILEELVLRFSNTPPKLDQFENIVKGLPRASNSCLITVQR